MTHSPQARLDWDPFHQLAPGVVAALLALGKTVDDSGLDKKLTELIKIRAAQLNGCAYCLQLHLNIARRIGVPSEQIDLVTTWPEVDVFSARERAALAWTDALTRMGQQPVSDAAYAGLQPHFSPVESAHLTAAIAAINAWNRIAGGLRFAPPIPRSKPVGSTGDTTV